MEEIASPLAFSNTTAGFHANYHAAAAAADAVGVVAVVAVVIVVVVVVVRFVASIIEFALGFARAPIAVSIDWS